MNNPKISVLMPVYNAEKFVCEAVDSILHQTFTDFEFLIINDASTDNTKQKIFAYKDSRIRYYENKINLGVAKTLNIGLHLAKSKYIARMDADDISLPERFEQQIRFMDENSTIAVCGTWLKLLNSNKNEIWKTPSDHKTIKSVSLFYSSIHHPTVLIRNDVLKRYNLFYNSSFSHVEDYELWVRIMEKARVANLKEVLLFHRIHSNHVGNVYKHIQIKNANKIRLYQLNKLGIFPTKEELSVHQAISYWKFKHDKKTGNAVRFWLIKLFIANLKKNYYDQLSFFKVLAIKWLFI